MALLEVLVGGLHRLTVAVNDRSIHPLIARLLKRGRTAAADRSEAGREVEASGHWVAGHRVPRDWHVTAPTSLPREDDHRLALQLPAGTSLRFEGSESFNDYWNGATYWREHRFLVIDGEHQGQRVTHIEWAYGDGDSDLRDAFPPPGLAPTLQNLMASGQSQDRQ